MLVTIKSSNQVWQSPDGQMKIWDFSGVLPDTNEPINAQTRSGKIASSLGQTLDLTTTVSKSGKTYFVQVPREGSQFPSNYNNAAAVTQTTERAPIGQAAPFTNDTSERLIRAIERFEEAVMRFERTQPMQYTDSASGDTVLTDLPSQPTAEALADFMGGEIVDDM